MAARVEYTPETAEDESDEGGSADSDSSDEAGDADSSEADSVTGTLKVYGSCLLYTSRCV